MVQSQDQVAYPHLPGYALPPQDQFTQATLTPMVTTNQFNAFCIDCQKNRSTHANITFGVFICGDCAKFLCDNFMQMEMYIKLLGEQWDPYQLTIAKLGGNEKFYEFMTEYKKEKLGIMEKYKSSAAKWYAKKLSADARGKEFSDIVPAKNSKEEWERAQVKGKELTDKAGTELKKTGESIKGGWNKYVLGKKDE